VQLLSTHASEGYGFVERENNEDVSVHHTAIKMKGYRTLERDAQVEFDGRAEGSHAANVVALPNN